MLSISGGFYKGLKMELLETLLLIVGLGAVVVVFRPWDIN
jgi:hypothetical protein